MIIQSAQPKTLAVLVMAALVMAAMLGTYRTAEALPNDARVPILLYHSRTAKEPCTYGHNDLLAMEEDLETLHAEGFTVVPVYWLVQWSLGWRDGSTLPDKVVGITIDDGFDLDFIDRSPNEHPCAPLKSAYTILREFQERYADELPDLSPHASLFVIASREVRNLLDPIDQHFGDNWWAAAHHSPLMEVYNHGASHDHPVIQEKLWEPTMEVWLPESGHADGIWEGKLSPERITTLESNRIYIRDSAEYLFEKIGAWPDLLAYPMGKVSNYTKNEYLPNYFHEHGTVAAFCTEIQARGPRPENYLQRGQDRWCLPRLTHGYSWRTPEEFLEVLRGTER